MSNPSVLGNFVLKKQQQFQAIQYHGPSHLREIEGEVEFKCEEYSDTPIIHDDGSIDVTNGGYHLPQFIGDTTCEPEYMNVKPGDVMVFPLYSNKNAFTLTKNEFDELYEAV